MESGSFGLTATALLSVALLLRPGSGVLPVTAFRGFSSGARQCSSGNTHGFNGRELVRVVQVGETTPTSSALQASTVLIAFALEIDPGATGRWQRLSWSQLEPHHGRKIHVVLVGADADVFAHTHPDSFSTPGPTDTVFEVQLSLPVAQPYTFSAQFYFDATAVELCVDEGLMHVHVQTSTEVFLLSDGQFGLSITGPDGSSDTRPPGGAVLGSGRRLINTTLHPGMDTAAVAYSTQTVDYAGCCQGNSAAGCAATQLDVFRFDGNDRPLAPVLATAPIPLNPANAADTPDLGAGAAPNCYAFQFQLAASPTGDLLTDLALWLDAPAHLLLARHSPTPGAHPDHLIHFHAMPGLVANGGYPQSSMRQRCQGQMAEMLPDSVINDAGYRFGPALWAATPELTVPGTYTLFATIRYADNAGTGAGSGASNGTARSGLIVPAFTFVVGGPSDATAEHRTGPQCSLGTTPFPDTATLPGDTATLPGRLSTQLPTSSPTTLLPAPRLPDSDLGRGTGGGGGDNDGTMSTAIIAAIMVLAVVVLLVVAAVWYAVGSRAANANANVVARGLQFSNALYGADEPEGDMI